MNRRDQGLTASLSESRTFLMGFAMLWIVLSHLTARLDLPQGRLLDHVTDFLAHGYGGCDIFLFLSGFGLARSLEGDSHPGRFLKRRAEKLLPAYYPFILAYIAIMAATVGITFKEILGDLTFTGFWFQWSHQFNWYIQALPAFYLLALLCRRTEEGRGTRPAAVWMACLSLLLLILAQGRYQLVAVSRVPVFLLGYFLNRLGKDLRWSWKWAVLLTAALILGVAALRLTAALRTWENGLYWYPFFLTAPALCLLLARLRPRWLKYRPLRAGDRFLCLFGTCSLEIYLIHDLAMEWMFQDMQGNGSWLLVAAVSCALGVGYHVLVEALVKHVKTSDGRTLWINSN